MNGIGRVIFLLLFLLAGCQPIVLENSSQPTEVVTSVDRSVANATSPSVGPTDVISAPTTAISTSSRTVTRADHLEAADAAVSGPTTSAEEPGADSASESGLASLAELQDGVEFTPAQVQAGQQIYRQQYCGVCHELEAIGTRGTFGPSHNDIGAIAAQRVLDESYRGAARNAASYLYESLVQPKIYIVPGYEATAHHMPPYTHISTEDLLALVAFLLAQQ